MKRWGKRWLLAGLAGGVLLGLSVTPRVTRANGAAPVSTVRDGRHDFDFEFGHWRSRLNVRRPLSKTSSWSSYVGTSVVRPVWNGKANLGELFVSGKSGRIEALSLRLYDPASHEWSISFANSSSGSVSVPTIGHFEGGRGDFYDRETYDGKPVRVRFEFANITPRSFLFTQAYSANEGKTWITNWTATFTR